MDEYKDDMWGWGTSDQSGEGGEKLCIREGYKQMLEFLYLKKRKRWG